MARRPTPPAPAPAALSSDDKRKGIRRFEAVLQRLESFDPRSVSGNDDPKITELAAAAKSALEKTFYDGTIENRRFARIGQIEYSMPMYVGGHTPLDETIDALIRMKGECTILVRQAIADLSEDLEEAEAPSTQPTQPQLPTERAAFIVHGHDEGAREAVARFLEQVHIRPIILHEQANRGRTIIEKFEAHGDVPFAVVLLTPDDVARGKTEEELRPRARQNVILELGYFIGKLGRARVCALKKGDVDQPSDILGVGYIELDDQGAWRQKLAQELDAAGLEINWNVVMRRS